MAQLEIEPFIGCENCSDTNGFIYTTDKNGYPGAEKCQCLIDYQRRQYLRYQMYKAGIPLSIIDYDVSSYAGEESADSVEKLKKYVSEFLNKYIGVSLYMWGPNGTQKTTLAMWIGREVLRKKKSVHYVFMDKLIKELTQEGFKEEVSSNLNTYRSVDLLIIDEAFDKGKVTWYNSDYQMSFLDRFLRQRLEQDRLPIIFVSNKDVPSIRSNFNNSLYELVDRNTKQAQLYFEDHFGKAENFESKDLWG